jgi:hypothetical protein
LLGGPRKIAAYLAAAKKTTKKKKKKLQARLRTARLGQRQARAAASLC